MNRFADLGAAQQLADALAARGYVEPTPVQAAVLGAAPDKDLLVSARTGSGKTVAFGLSFAPQVLAGGRALVVAPTRELAQQVARELAWLYAGAGVRVATCVGGADMRAELRALREGPRIVVGTPGRLVDHLERGSLDLSSLRALVLDEADEMLDMGFRDELERILSAAPGERRTLLFSATMPKEIEALARKYQRDPLRLTVSSPAEAHADIEVRAHLVAAREREHAVVNVLRLAGIGGALFDGSAAIVFCATREGVTHLTANLTERGFAAVPLSGELTQAERNRALLALRDGRARVLVATDVAARGLDLPDVGLVIQADPPQNAEVMQHRSGRTGRAGRKGVSVLLVPPQARNAVTRMLRGRVQFTPAPGADVIRVRDRDRLVREIGQLVREPAEDDIALARLLLRDVDAEALAAALVKIRREALPAPEDLPLSAALASKKPERAARPEARRDEPKRDAHPREAHPREAKRDAHPREPKRDGHAAEPRAAFRKPGGPRGGAAGVWFRINIGKTRNADPRWLLPIICRRGNVTRQQVGRIEVTDDETRFQVAAPIADAFRKAVQRPDRQDPGIRITLVRE